MTKLEKLRDQEVSIIAKLEDLIIQATKERSHYYVKSVAEEAIHSIKLAKEREAKLVEGLELALSFCPKGPVPEGLAPMFYHTLNYQDEVKLQKRIDEAREALADHKRMMEE